MSWSKIAWAVVCVASAAGCSGSYAECGEGEEVSVTVDTSGGAPVFDWEFGTAYVVDVSEPDDEDGYGREMWHLQCGGDNDSDGNTYEKQVCIQTPIAYGDRVDSEFFDTVNFTPPRQLKPGKTYHLVINTFLETDDPSCGDLKLGEAEFVAP